MDENEICGIFIDSLLLFLKQQTLNYIEMDFGVMTKKAMLKEKVLIELGTLKYASSTWHKENKNPYAKKELKNVNMA